MTVAVMPCLSLFAQTKGLPIDTFPGHSYILIVPRDSQLVMTDSLFYIHSRGVQFKVNKTDIDPRDSFFTNFRNLLPQLSKSDVRIRGSFIRGAASPEGPYLNNQRLARERAEVLKKQLDSISATDYHLIPITSQTNVSEDYDYLLYLMRKAGDADYKTVADVIVKSNGNDALCKQRLKQLQGGRLWNRLLKEYYPKIRRSGIVLWGYVLPPPRPYVEPSLPSFDIPAVNITVAPQLPTELPRKRMLALRTNLVHDFLWLPHLGWSLTPNLQAEYFPLYGHFTVGGGFSYANHRHWRRYKFYQMRDAQLEVRRYFRGGGTFEGPYMGVYGEYTKYGIGFNDEKGWEGEGGGGGMTLGHTMRLTHKGNFRLELSLSLGYFYTRYDPYVWGNPKNGTVDGLFYYKYTGRKRDFIRRNHERKWLGPTNIGIQLTYDILYHKRGAGMQKKGGDK